MSEFWNKLNDVSDMLDSVSSTLKNVSSTLDDVNSTVDVTSYGIRRTQAAKENINNTIKRAMSEENKRDRYIIMECEKIRAACVRRTVIICILMVIATVLICMFL